MNHQKIYDQIIHSAKSKNRSKLKKNHKDYIYYENHHILPKCLDGNSDEDNLVLLTAREHYVCHKLLTYIYKGNRKIVNAFWRMTWNKLGKHNLSSKDYAYSVELIKLIPMSTETKQKISNNMLGTKHPMYGKHQLYASNEKYRLSHLGISTWNKGKHTRTGESNFMYKKTYYSIWVEKFGKEIADQKLTERNKKASISLKGK